MENGEFLARSREERQAWDVYFAEALANSARYRTAAIAAKSNIASSTLDETLAKCAEIADSMLAIRRKRFELFD